ncbi:MAG: FMN-binding protein [Acidimicrobiales bacterium]
MRRAPFVLVATAAGLAGVLTFHPRKASFSAAPATQPATSPTTAAPAGAGSAPTAVPAGGARSALGSLVQYGYGELAANVTVSGKKITGISVPKLLTADSYSQQLAVQVIPMLRHEVLSAQSANVQTISGATYTSLAYFRSVQLALNQLHV